MVPLEAREELPFKKRLLPLSTVRLLLEAKEAEPFRVRVLLCASKAPLEAMEALLSCVRVLPTKVME